MIVLITGSRDWKDRAAIRAYLERFPPGTTVIEGGARGADYRARRAAFDLGFDVITYWANWKRHGKEAGPIRNQRMLSHNSVGPDRVGAFPLPQSRGTYDMIRRAESAGIPVDIWPFEEIGNADG